MTTELLDSEPVDGGAPPIDLSMPPPVLDWQTDKRGKEYIPKPQGRGMIYRLDDETVDQALERDRMPKDSRPRRKPKAPKMPDPSKKPDLKELELTLAEALKAPAMPCAMFGDTWAAEHFTVSGPYLARNLILAADHNPWLKMKLEEAATGQDAMMKMVSLVGVGGALFGYAIPPIIYWLNIPVPDRTRQMFGIPARRERPPEYAVTDDAAAAEEPIAA